MSLSRYKFGSIFQRFVNTKYKRQLLNMIRDLLCWGRVEGKMYAKSRRKLDLPELRLAVVSICLESADCSNCCPICRSWLLQINYHQNSQHMPKWCWQIKSKSICSLLTVWLVMHINTTSSYIPISLLKDRNRRWHKPNKHALFTECLNRTT